MSSRVECSSIQPSGQNRMQWRGRGCHSAPHLEELNMDQVSSGSAYCGSECALPSIDPCNTKYSGGQHNIY